MDAAFSRTQSAVKPALTQFGRRLQGLLREFGASVDRYLNRLYENLPKDRPNV
jgi:hypothetical protein